MSNSEIRGTHTDPMAITINVRSLVEADQAWQLLCNQWLWLHAAVHLNGEPLFRFHRQENGEPLLIRHTAEMVTAGGPTADQTAH